MNIINTSESYFIKPISFHHVEIYKIITYTYEDGSTKQEQVLMEVSDRGCITDWC